MIVLGIKVSKCIRLVLTAAFFFSSSLMALPQYDADQHLGVASCASSVCHGKSKPVTDNNVLLNEYRTWSTEDRHARAYKTLLSKDSVRIARNLGLPSAHTAKICLDCHADNVPKDKRGPKFQIDDGVGCESCHGGAEQWIESHTEEGVTHEQNLAKNIYPTEDGVARAKLCLSCHYGTKDKMATHKIMGAGHPRLSFELETFSANQPAHYKIDADYKKRKPEFSGFNMWVVGQLEAAKSALKMMQTYLINKNELVPELYFYDCHACHHPMSDTRWGPTKAKAGLSPGVIRLNDANFLMLLEITKVILPNQHQLLQKAVVQLHQGSVASKAKLERAVNNLKLVVDEIDQGLANTAHSNKTLKTVRARLLMQSASGEYRDFSAAEQAFLAIESITIALQQDATLEKQLNLLYSSLEDENNFSPLKFKAIVNKVKRAFE